MRNLLLIRLIAYFLWSLSKHKAKYAKVTNETPIRELVIIFIVIEGINFLIYPAKNNAEALVIITFKIVAAYDETGILA